ncbi:MAG: hypothetical protein IT348_10350 [Candidatus Eisenbacteria bacterium]|nr:hypothetical protein [Candidatus Eisenbacteria bacterium]
MYLRHPSTFDPIATVIASTADPCDPAQVAATVTRVNEMIANRIREETVGEGALRIDYARERISGSITDLRLLKRRAGKANALPELVSLIDNVIAEAERARDAAPRRQPQTADAGPRPADWATAEIDEPQSLLPEFLQNI